MKTVLPPDAGILAVGGIGAGRVDDWFSAGACGIGIGSEIYNAGDTAATVFKKASAVVSALRNKEKKP